MRDYEVNSNGIYDFERDKNPIFTLTKHICKGIVLTYAGKIFIIKSREYT